MTDHVFLNEHLQEFVPVVNLKRMAHKLRDDRAGPCPGLDGLLGLVVVQTGNLFEEFLVDVGTFFGAGLISSPKTPGRARD